MTPLLPLFQLLDSSFPTGAFSHSLGLETVVQEGRIKDSGDLAQWLTSHLSGSLVPMEGGAVYLAQRAAHSLTAMEGLASLQAREKLIDLDRRVTLSKLAREVREAGIKVGKRYLHIVKDLYPKAGLDRYEAWISQGRCFGSACIVHGWICAELDYPASLTVSSFLYMGVNTLVQNALRTMIIGQTEAQRVLVDLLPLIEAETDRLLADPPSAETLFGRTLFQEIGGMRHETLYSRLFMS